MPTITLLDRITRTPLAGQVVIVARTGQSRGWQSPVRTNQAGSIELPDLSCSVAIYVNGAPLFTGVFPKDVVFYLSKDLALAIEENKAPDDTARTQVQETVEGADEQLTPGTSHLYSRA